MADDAEQKAEGAEDAEGSGGTARDRERRRLLPVGLIVFIVVCIAMMVALTYYVWRLLARL